MLAAFHRDLIAAPFLGSRRLVIRDGSTHVQNDLRDHAAKISASSSFHLSQKLHLDEHGHALVWSDDKTCAARQNRVKVIFTGRLLNYEEICSLYYDCERMLRAHDPARLLLHLYLQGYKDQYGDPSDQPSTLLNSMEGDFNFILHDSNSRYTLVARKGAAPLFWGVDDGNGDNVIISTMPAYLSSFPAGCAFESQVNEEGEGDSRMFNFERDTPSQRGVDTIRRIDSKGHLCGLMFKSRSGHDLVHVPLAPRNVF
ncbi:g9676 [Coccomyxa elongata]